MPNLNKKNLPKIVDEPRNEESTNSEKEKQTKLKNSTYKEGKYEDSCCHPAFDYETYKRRPN